MSMQTTGDNSSGEPMLDVNVTPLIDVMLVLLIMFIITIPIQTHAVKLDLPVQQNNPPPQVIDPVKNVLSINAQDQVLAVTKQAHVQKMGFVGNEYYMNVF